MAAEATPPESLLASALADFVDREARGERVDPDAFCRQYPEIADELGRQIRAISELDAVIETAPAPSAPLPQHLSGCRIIAEIGSGGMGRVLLAEDEALGRRVAIKTLAPAYAGRADLRERFMREARAMARLAHPNIARIYSLGPAEEAPHFVMEFVEGAELTTAAQPLDLTQKAALLRKVVLAVAFLHEHHIVHRDLKPGNILVGPDLEPKLLDFGLAAETDRRTRLTRPGEIFGTPDYLSPEQARGEAAADERSDVFSLGAILYEMLTGAPPFAGGGLADRIHAIRERDPVLPRRLDPQVPGDLQNICMKALEKNPAGRYRTAREMAADLERFLAGEPVLAAPPAYARLMAGKIDQHLRELQGWRQDHLLSDAEYDGLRKGYDRLNEREDAWILESRRLSVAQVSLYLGAWVLAVAAALVVLFDYKALAGARAVAAVALALAPTLWIGLRRWNAGDRRIAVAYLLASCLLLPVLALVVMGECRFFTAPTRARENLELFSKLPSFKRISNAQLWWAVLLSLPAYIGLRRFTRSSVFTLVFAFMTGLFAFATLLRMGMIEWAESDPGRIYFHLMPWAAGFLATGMVLERRGHTADSRQFYPMAVLFTLVALSGVAATHEPYRNWLNAHFPWTRAQIEYLFIANAGIYFALQWLCDTYHSAQMRAVAKAFRFVIPGHVLTSLLLLGLEASRLWEKTPQDFSRRFEARAFEFILPVAAAAIVFASVRKQMKNFFVTGSLFVAIGIVRLQQDFFKGRARWPVALLAAGVLLMMAAAHVTGIKLFWARLQFRAGKQR